MLTVLFSKQAQHGPAGIYIRDVTNNSGAHVDLTVAGQSTDPGVLAVVGVVIDQGSGDAQGLTLPLNVKFTGGTPNPAAGALILRQLRNDKRTETYRSLHLRS